MMLKICGLTRKEDLDVCLALGVDLIGLNLTTVSPRRIDPARAAELARYIGSDARPVWILDATPPGELLGLLSEFPESYLQRCDSAWPWPESLAEERRMEVVRLTRNGDIERAALRTEPLLVCDAPGVLGGSGKPADWAFARTLARRKNILLAGGLNAENVADAIRVVQPSGVDVASGVESSPGVKDHEKLRAFVQKVRS